MDYISAKEASEKWNVNIRVVQDYCKQGRISKAKKYGNYWMLPADAKKPIDPRKLRKKPVTAPFYTLPKKCPELIFTTIYSRPGSGDKVTKSLGGEAQALFACQLAYFRGETDSAKTSAQRLLTETENPDVKFGCLFVLALCAMYEGNVALWLKTRRLIEEIPCRTPDEKAQRDFQLGNADSGIYEMSSFPEWFLQGEFDPLPADCYPLARFLFIKWMMISSDNRTITPVCRPFISQSRMEGALLSEIYCLLINAIIYHDLGDPKTSVELLDVAIQKALPDRLFSPFAEYRSEFGVLMDDRLEAADKSALVAVRDLNKRLIAGWGVLCREVRGLKYSDDLTLRERHAAKLAANGLGNAEIAARMNVSINSVKRYISDAIAKTGAPNRDSLVEYMAMKKNKH